jgi:hypothetical protein
VLAAKARLKDELPGSLRSCSENGCPILATSLFLSLGWETTKLHEVISTKHRKWVPQVSILRPGIPQTPTSRCHPEPSEGSAVAFSALNNPHSFWLPHRNFNRCLSGIQAIEPSMITSSLMLVLVSVCYR